MRGLNLNTGRSASVAVLECPSQQTQEDTASVAAEWSESGGMTACRTFYSWFKLNALAKLIFVPLSILLASCNFISSEEIFERIVALDPSLSPEQALENRSKLGVCVYAKILNKLPIEPQTVSQDLFDPSLHASSTTGIWYRADSLRDFTKFVSSKGNADIIDHMTATGVDAKNCFETSDDFFAVAEMKDVVLFISSVGDAFLIVQRSNPKTLYYLAGGI